jgi:decaprenylphospho-beta-D-ribofuranose 2-oxidase
MLLPERLDERASPELGDVGSGTITGAALCTRPARLSGWGGGPAVPARIWRPRDHSELCEQLGRMHAEHSQAGVIARGMGRAYGDAAQLAGGLVVQTGALRDFTLDERRGVLTAQAGITAAELLAELVGRGFVLPVLPGTQHVSIGGMIASDVHGKNHGQAGSFGSHVLRLGLITADGELRELSPDGSPQDAAAFAATVGGMGLTGVIAWAQIALRPISSPLLEVDTDRCDSLDQVLDALRQPGGSHRVAWLDLLASERNVRGVVTRAEFLADEAAQIASDAVLDARPLGVDAAWAASVQATRVPVRATVPARWPIGLPSLGVRAFNELYFRLSPRRARGELVPLGRHMFPLDRLGAWPRLYGADGLVQYQLAVPPGAEAVLEQTIAILRSQRVPCFLAVLKDFGDGNDAPLSFPIRGWTLALDLPRRAAHLEAALRRCDELVAAAGGRVYLSKDSRLSRAALEAMYPRLDDWLEIRARLDPHGRWRSDMALRLGLVEGPVGADGRAPGAGSAPSAGRAPGAGSAPAGGPVLTGQHAQAARRVLVLGGSSEIATAIVGRLALGGQVSATLLGRNEHRLAQTRQRLLTLGVREVACGPLDVLRGDDEEAILEDAFARSAGFDIVLVALGLLGAQEGLDADPARAREVLQVNAVGAPMLTLGALRRLRAQGSGSLVVLSSVAAERPRAANAVYGAAKAALDALAQGLSDSLCAVQGVEVIVVRPGFVRTKMTAGLRPAPFATSADAVAAATVAAIGRGSRTIWVPSSLRWVFAALRHLPRPVYRRLPL